MGKKIDLEKTQVIEAHGNGLVLTLTLEGNNRILARVESEEGGRQIGVKPHEEDGKTLVFYLKETGPRFTVI